MLNTRRNPSYHEGRTKATIKFCDYIPKGEKVLDIGEPNPLSRELGERLGVVIHNTVSDLDHFIFTDIHIPFGKYRWATCFEVIEHLMNPRSFFENLYNITTTGATVFLSYPSRPKWMWNNEEHFHEYDKLRFKYLLEKTGWKIVRKKPVYVRRWPTGIRPLLRNFIPQTTLYELRKI